MWRENTVENIIDRNDIKNVKSNALNRQNIPWKANRENWRLNYAIFSSIKEKHRR